MRKEILLHSLFYNFCISRVLILYIYIYIDTQLLPDNLVSKYMGNGTSFVLIDLTKHELGGNDEKNIVSPTTSLGSVSANSQKISKSNKRFSSKGGLSPNDSFESNVSLCI